MDGIAFLTRRPNTPRFNHEVDLLSSSPHEPLLSVQAFTDFYLL